MLIYVTEQKDIHQSAVELLKKKGHRIIFKPDADAEVLFIRTYTQVTKEYLDTFPMLKYILRSGVGLDNIDLDESKRRKIQVINAPGSNANAVAEMVVGVIIMALRNIQIESSRLREGKWREKTNMGHEMKDLTLGLLGCGAIGRLIAYKLKNFDLKEVVGYDPYLDKQTLLKSGIRKCELDELLQSADIISLHLPLTPETKNLISAEKFAMMKQNAVLINTSRGGIVNEADLIDALKKRTIHAAALDVFEQEPNIKKELLHLPNLIVTPHIAGYTYEADEAMALMPVQKFLEVVQ